MPDRKNIIDSHVHLDLIGSYHPELIGWLRDNHCGVVSWSYFDGIDSVRTLEDRLRSLALYMEGFVASGMDCYFLAGVHPHSIPPDLRPEQIHWQYRAGFVDDQVVSIPKS